MNQRLTQEKNSNRNVFGCMLLVVQLLQTYSRTRVKSPVISDSNKFSIDQICYDNGIVWLFNARVLFRKMGINNVNP